MCGGHPANFMDIRTTANTLDIAYGFGMLLANQQVRALLVNVHGGGMQRCDTIAEGLGIAVRKASRSIPIVIRMAGNNAAYAKTVLANHGVNYVTADLDGGRGCQGRCTRAQGGCVMAILVDANTRVVCQGITGRTATFHCARMQSYGTKLVAGVVPGKGGRNHLDVPVFDRLSEAIEATKANASMLFVPPANAGAAIIEAIEAELPLIVAVTERIPVLDMVRVRQALAGSKTRLIGPNSQGILAPGIAQLGVMSTVDARKGRIGIVSRSASLTSEIVMQTTRAGLGQSTTVGVGGDPVHGLGLAQVVELFLADPDTDGIIVIGEIGGTEEEE